MMVTERQKLAVKFCEQQLGIKFKGSLDNLSDIHPFLAGHLTDAKRKYVEDQEINERFERCVSRMKRDASSLCR